MFYVPPKHWKGACTPHPTSLYPSRTSYVWAGCHRALGPLHFVLLTASHVAQYGNMKLYRAQWEEQNKENIYFLYV